MLLVSIGFVVIGIFIIDREPNIAWGSILFFGLCAIVFIINLTPGSSYLKLTEEGLEIKSLYRSHFIPWESVKVFKVSEMRIQYHTKKMVMFDYSNLYTKQKVGRKLARIVSGSEGTIPDTYGMSPENLAQFLNDWKANLK